MSHPGRPRRRRGAKTRSDFEPNARADGGAGAAITGVASGMVGGGGATGLASGGGLRRAGAAGATGLAATAAFGGAAGGLGGTGRAVGMGGRAAGGAGAAEFELGAAARTDYTGRAFHGLGVEKVGADRIGTGER